MIPKITYKADHFNHRDPQDMWSGVEIKRGLFSVIIIAFYNAVLMPPTCQRNCLLCLNLFTIDSLLQPGF